MNASSALKLGAILLACIPMAPASAHDHSVPSHGDARVQYVANKGQWDASVRFKAAFPTSAMFLQSDGITWVRYQDDAADLVHEYIQWEPERQATFSLRGHAWKMHFVGADANAVTKGEARRAEYHNYFLGNDPAMWASHVPVFEGVEYHDLWPGIDLRWHSAQAQVKYDLVLAPGADPSLIAFSYDGLDGLVVDAKGNLVLRTSVGDLTELQPVAWYADDHRPLACAFKLEGDRVGFRFPQGADRSRGIVIDPLLMGATYSGQVGASNYGHCATYDELGNMYGGAQNFGVGLPATVGAFQTVPGSGITDIVVNKFTPNATTLIWATYIGGSSDEKPHSMIVNSNNELCIMGSTTGTGFPTSAGCYDASHNGQADIVIVHLNNSASALIGSTYLGGSQQDGRQSMTNNYGDTYRGEIMLDASENIYIASASQSPDFPTTAGAYQTALGGNQDAVVVGVNPTCSALLMSTFLGGAQIDNGLGLRFDPAGDIYVCGGTASPNFPMVAGGYQGAFQGGAKDGYVVKLSGNGSALINSTFFGTSGDDMAYFIDLDNDNDVYLYGQSDGAIPISPAGIYGSASGGIFLTAFEPTLTTPVFTTKVGSTGGFGFQLAPVAFLVDVCEHIYISGYNPSGTWETTPDALYQASFSQFYLAAYDVDMAGILFGTYYGGSHVDGGTSRFDKDGIIYQGVCSGGQSMPTTAGAYAPVNNVGWDLGVFKIDFQVAGVNAAGASTLNSGCAPVQIDFSNTSTGTDWLWDFGDGTPPVMAFEPSHTYTTPGAFTVMMIAMDSLSCNLADTTYLPITIGQAQPLTAGFTLAQDPDCTLLQVVVTNTSTGTPLAFDWDMGDGTFYTDTNVTHNYSVPGPYDIQLIAYDPTGCSQPDTVVQTVVMAPPLQVDALFDVTETPGCDQLTVVSQNNTTGVTPTYLWDMGDGVQYASTNVNHTYSGVGTYTITLIANDAGSCNLADTVTLDVTVLPSLPVAVAFTAGQLFDCDNMLLSTDNQSTGTNLLFDWQLSDGTQYTDTNVTHVFSGAGTYTITLTVSDALGCSPPQTASIDVTIDPLVPVVAAFSVTQVNQCTQLDVEGLNLSTGDSVSYSWNMGDGTVLTTLDAQHTYTQPGQYTITLTVTDLGCGQDDAMSLPVEMIDQLPILYAGDTVICPGSVAVLSVFTDPGFDYLWSTGSTDPSIIVDEPGTYTVTVSDSLCDGTASVDVIDGPVHALYDSLEACPKASVELMIPIQGLSYHWATGATTRHERVVGPGIYVYDLIDLYGCPHTDSLKVIGLDSIPQLYAPNAFTPDGDGVNDTFLISGFGEKAMSMTVFNRWGERLWESTRLTEPWDGKYGGGVVQDGVYVYLLKYVGVCDPEEREMIGHVTVVR
ncbi:MAG: PKD domain-containing protein [Flavobacteriales bacterium]|nr:PKD domain-containing protein [Flavobacteriales bacterium]